MSAREFEDIGLCRPELAEIGKPFWRKSREIDMSKEIFSPATLPPPTGYSHVAKVNKGTLVYWRAGISDESGKMVGEGNFEAQVEQVFRTKARAGAAGATMADIVKLNTYLVAEVGRTTCRNAGDPRPLLNKDKPPASTLVVVSRLARPGWLIEIEAVAAID